MGQAQILARKGTARESAAGAAVKQPDSIKPAAPKEAAVETAQLSNPLLAPQVSPTRADADPARQDSLACAAAVASPKSGCEEGSAADDRGPGIKSRGTGKENNSAAASPAAAPITPVKRRLERHLPGEAQGIYCASATWTLARQSHMPLLLGAQPRPVLCCPQRPRAASEADPACKRGRPP